MQILQTTYFTVDTYDKPHIDRNDGGHIIISPKVPIEDRTKLSLQMAHELIELSMIIGEAMVKGMKKSNIEIGRINYQDNGNWRNVFHLHLYGRAVNAILQPYGTALQFPKTQEEFKNRHNLQPLTAEDIKNIQDEAQNILKIKKYSILIRTI